MRSKFLFPVLLAMAIGSGNAALSANKIIAQVPVQDDWLEGGVRFDIGPRSYKYRYNASVKNGVVILCGAGTFISASFRAQTMKVLKNQAFYIDDTIYYDNIDFFAKIKGKRNLVGVKANCVSTGKAPPKQIKDGVGILSRDPKRVYRD